MGGGEEHRDSRALLLFNVSTVLKLPRRDGRGGQWKKICVKSIQNAEEVMCSGGHRTHGLWIMSPNLHLTITHIIFTIGNESGLSTRNVSDVPKFDQSNPYSCLRWRQITFNFSQRPFICLTWPTKSSFTSFPRNYVMDGKIACDIMADTKIGYV